MAGGEERRIVHVEGGGTRERAARWLAAALPAVLLAALLALAFRGPLAGRLFYLRDITQNHGPIRHLVSERLRAGALPLWDPYHGGGTPLLANPDNLVLHPISLLFLVLPFDAAFTASIVLQFLLLAWGGYLLARRAGCGPPGATLAAAVLSLSGPAASLASMQNLLCGAAWVPLGVWAYLAGRRPGSRWLLSPAALCLGVVLSVGEPAALSAFLLLAALLVTTGPDVPGPDGGRPGRALLDLGMVAAAAVLIAAAQLLPARQLLALSSRGAGFAAAEGLKWSLEPVRLLEAVAPRLFGDPTRLSPESWWGRWIFEGGYPFLLSLYVGAIPCLLAAAGALRRGPAGRRGRALGVLACGALLLALGRNSMLGRLAFQGPPFGREARYPERFALVALFAVALLAGLGLERILADPERGRTAVLGFAACAAAGFAAITIVAASPTVVDRFLEGPARVPRAVLQSDAGGVIRGALLRSGLWAFAETAILALGAAAAVAAKSVRKRALAGWAVVAAAGLSMTAAAGPALSTAAPGWLNAPSPLAGALPHGPDAGRVHHAPRPEGLSVWGRTDELVWGYRFDRFTYLLATGHRDRVPTIFDAATDRMDLRDMVDLGRALEGLPLEGRIKILSLAHAGFLFTHETLDHPGLEPGPALADLSRPPLRLYRLRAILPRARFVPRAVPAGVPGDLARSLADPGFDPRTSVMLDGPPPPDGVAPGGGAGQATIVEDEPERVRIRVEAPAPGYLVLADAFAPGWSARLDGTAATILKADGIFRAVAVPAGDHEVEMRYRPAAVRAGLGISATALVLAAAWGAAMWRRRA